MAINHKRAHLLTGGGVGAIDKIDGAALSVGDTIQCINISGIYDYVNVQDSRSELSPFTIRPNTNPGTNSWHLVGTTARIGALVNLTSDEGSTSGSQLIVPWDAATYDDASFWSGGDPTKLTVPVGVIKVKVVGNLRFDTMTGTSRMILLKNAGTAMGLPSTHNYVDISPSSSSLSINVVSAKIDVVATDYFTLSATQWSGGALDLLSDNRTWFSIEAVGFA